VIKYFYEVSSNQVGPARKRSRGLEVKSIIEATDVESLSGGRVKKGIEMNFRL
jgi:hypothetical protein